MSALLDTPDPGVYTGPDYTRRRTPSARKRVRLIALPLAVASAIVFAGAAPMASAATNITSRNVSVSVSGSTATSTATFISNPSVTADWAGVCVRDSAGRNYDFDKQAGIRLRSGGTTVTSSRSLPAGTYSYWPCVLASGAWTSAGAAQTFTVGTSTTPGGGTTGGGTTGGVSSGTAMPVGNLPGWTQSFTEDFNSNVSRGGFPGPYSSKWLSYNNFPDTSQKGWYDQRIISAHDGVLDLYLHTENGRPLGAAPVPLVNGKWGGQVYGRFSVRLKSASLHGYGTGFILWPDSDNWYDGEIDFPESDLAGTVKGYNHCLGNPSSNCLIIDTNYRYTDWHTYTIDWTPSKLTYYVDGAVVGSTTSNIPSKPMHWVMQTATTGITPDSSTAGNMLIDWATIYRYTP